MASSLHQRHARNNDASSSISECNDLENQQRRNEHKWTRSIRQKHLFNLSIKVGDIIIFVQILIAISIILSTTGDKSKLMESVKFFTKSIETNELQPTYNVSSIVPELHGAKQALTQAKSQTLTPLRPIDRNQYTIRINTWRRNKQLLASVNHYSTCPGVHQIQIVWCDKENQPSQEILDMTQGEDPKVVVEYHPVNSLNERFNVMSKPETLGILSIDDDVLRPCEAVDDGFFRWTDNPERMVGFDYRMHVPKDGKWVYGALSTTQKSKRYSLSLTRFCFLHVDYLGLYMKHMPKEILDTIDENFNCEDIAMSFFISALTKAQVPLLAHGKSIGTMVKLSSPGAISSTAAHKNIRSDCVDRFGYLLGLKDGYKDILDKDSDTTNWKRLEPQKRESKILSSSTDQVRRGDVIEILTNSGMEPLRKKLSGEVKALGLLYKHKHKKRRRKKKKKKKE